MAQSSVALLPDVAKGFLFQASYRTMSDDRRDRFRKWFSIASIDLSLRMLKTLGFSPSMIVDGGAFKGDWTKMAKSIFPDASVLMLDADQNREADLRAVVEAFPGSVSYEMVLLGSCEKENVPFFETIDATGGSSVLDEQSTAARNVVQRRQLRLDSVVERISRRVDFLKLDVQGFELEVLKGAPKTLEQAEVVLLELSIVAVNKGAPLLHEAIKFMNEHGFIAHDVCELHRRPLDDALVQIDVIFVRSTSALRKSDRWDAPDAGQNGSWSR